MAKKYYVVWAGHKPGIYQSWPEAQAQVNQFPGAKYKSFPTKAEAEAAYASGGAGASTGPARSRGTTRSNNKPKPVTSETGVNPDIDITLFCDGGCDPNPGKAGSGIAVYRRDKLVQLWYGKFNPQGTNNFAELNALLQSLSLAKIAIEKDFSVEIRCDSMYSIQCIRDWAAGWKKRGWKRKDGEIQNLELIQQAFEIYQQIKGKLTLSHVKAHAGTEGNELADRMTMVAVDKKDPEWVKYPAGDDGQFDIVSLLKLRAG